MELLARTFLVTFVALRGEKEAARFSLQPGGDTKFSISIAGRGVDVVDPIFEQDVECLVRDSLGNAAERRGTEHDASALVPGTAELDFVDPFVTPEHPTRQSLPYTIGLGMPELPLDPNLNHLRDRAEALLRELQELRP